MTAPRRGVDALPPVALPDVAATEALGAALAAVLRAGDVVLLDGPLGAGKTVVVRGLARGLGVRGTVTSPTFVLAREHRPAVAGRPGLVHVDAYRLRPEGDAGVPVDPGGALADLDLPVETSVVAVEWGEGLGDVLADSWLTVSLARPSDDRRTAVLTASGPRWDDPSVAALATAVGSAVSTR